MLLDALIMIDMAVKGKSLFSEFSIEDAFISMDAVLEGEFLL